MCHMRRRIHVSYEEVSDHSLRVMHKVRAQSSCTKLTAHRSPHTPPLFPFWSCFPFLDEVTARAQGYDSPHGHAFFALPLSLSSLRLTSRSRIFALSPFPPPCFWTEINARANVYPSPHGHAFSALRNVCGSVRGWF